MVTLDHLDARSLLELSRRTDPCGVLTVYFDADPTDPPNLEGAAIDLRNRLRDLQRQVDESRVPRRTLAMALERLQPTLNELASPTSGGRGRVLFAAISDDWTVQLASQLSVRNRVVLDDGAFIHPLLELLDEGRPAGVLIVSGEQARLFDWRLGALRALDEQARAYVEAPHERAGQIGGGPHGQYNSPMREQRQARGREQAQRFLTDVATIAAARSEEHGWQRLLVSGGPRWTPQLLDQLPQRLPADVVVVGDTRVFSGSTERVIADAVTDRLHETHAEYEADLLQRVQRASASGNAVMGISKVAAALNGGRVSHVVYDPEVRYFGSLGADGTLFAGDEASGDGAALTAEPRLTERLVERALQTDARVSPIEGAASGLLADSEGTGALLRW